MYLKRLDIQGFKSFAEKISLEFIGGITSVVGPNGSGKSNIADAVRWVLGEQSAKTLRGTKMEDVIFAGTEHRKPLGFAEVSLTIDNSDNTLPVEYTEVTVTRRVFRSGESEYLINKTSCRLKDVHELFMDTGLGKDGYSIIGQGRVDEILSNKSEDRRHIFEEASGIMKFKVRKTEAEKKLELTRINMLRINDIINELDAQVEPLREQSEVAKKYLNFRDSLKDLEVNVYVENIAKYKEKGKEFQEQYFKIKEDVDKENLKLLNVTENNKEQTDLVKSLDEKLNIAREELSGLDGSLERSNSEINLNDEKKNNLVQNITRLDNEVAEINQKMQQLSKDEGSKLEKLKYLDTQFEDYAKKLTEYEKQMETLMNSLNVTERHVEELKTSIMDKLDILSDKRTQINSIKSNIESLKKRQTTLVQESHQLTLDKDKENMKKEDLNESIRDAKLQISQSKEKQQKFIDEKVKFESSLDEKRKEQNTIKYDIQFKTSRYNMLRDMENNLEGYNRSVKEVLSACHQSKEFGHGIHGALAQLITVDQKYETAVEMSLGGALQNIITSTEEDAKKAIEFLKKNKLGRATFLPISSVKGRYFDNKIFNDIKQHKGFCGVASDLVQYKSEYSGIILSFLGKVVVVEDIETGISMARSFGYSFRIVTLDGDILSTSGSMSGGSTDNRGQGILSRSREIPELKEGIDVLKTKEVEVEDDITNFAKQLNIVLGKMTCEDDIIRNNELIKMRDESHLAQIEENINKVTAKIEMFKDEKSQLERQEEETEKELEKYIKESDEIELDISETKKVVAEYTEKHKIEQTERDNLYMDITDFKISVNSIVESKESIKDSVDRINDERNASHKNISRRNDEKTRNLTEIESLKAKNEGIRNLIRNFEAVKTGKTLQMDRLSEEKKINEEDLYDIVNEITNINKNVMLLQEELNRIEVKKARMEAETDAIQNRLWDDYEVTFTNALENKKDIGSITQAQKRINELKAEIKELGPVNVSAIEDYVKTKERFEFMSIQKNDMEQAEEKLQKVITEMTTIMKRQFIEQFKLINENFNIVFNELFEGGRADLVIVDKENILDSGIEIEVQPPGKKLQNMMLLSGGERAFTAIALLFAILRLRPTPFCVLDEIESALDDANVYRFAEYIRKFTSLTQFIMVTHRKGTMEASDTLYGVTMQERGISKVVSMKMDEKIS